MTIKDTLIAIDAKLEEFKTRIGADELKIDSIAITDANSAVIAEVKADIAAIKAELLPTPTA